MALHDILVRVGADTSRFTKGINRATSLLTGFAGAAVTGMDHIALAVGNTGNETGSRISRMQTKYAQLGASATGAAGVVTSAFATITAASTVAIGALVLHAARFEHAFADVRKTTDASERQFEELNRQIRDMSLVMPESANEIAGVAAAAGQLGVEIHHIEGFTESMTMLGVAAEDLSATDAATELARFMNIMNTDYENVDRLASTVVDLGNNLATTEGQIVNMAQRLAGAGAQVNMSESDVLSFAGTLSSLGLRSEMAGTAFSRVMLNMNSAVMEGGEELNKFAEVSGMSAEQFKRAFEEDAATAIISFVSGLDRMNNSGGDVVGTLDELSLGEIRVRDTLLRSAKGVDLMTESLNRGRNAWQENTALQTEYEEKSSTLIARLQILGNQFSYVARVVGTILMDALIPVIGAVETFVGWLVTIAQALEDASDRTQKWVGRIILAVPIIGALGTAFAGVVTVVLAAYTALAGLGAILGVTTAAALGTVAAISGIVIGIGAIATAVGIGGVALIAWLTDSGDEAKALREDTEALEGATDDLAQATFESSAAYAERKQAIDENHTANSELASQLDNLASKEEKSVGDKTLLKSMVDDLNASVHDLNLVYDESADSLSMSNEQIQARVDLMKEEEKAIAGQERLVELEKERVETEMLLEETIALREEWNKKLEDSGFFVAEARGKVDELTESEEELRAQLEELGIQYDATEETVVNASENMTNIIQENNLNQIESYKDLEEEMRNKFEEMAQTYLELQETATNAFEKINTESEYSLEEMIENMEHNRKATEEWGENRAAIMEWASKEGHTGFMKWVEQLGIDHAGELGEMAKALDENSDEQVSMLEELAQGYDENSQAAMEAYGANLGDGFEEFLRMVEEFANDSSTTLEEELIEAGFYELGEYIPEEVSGGMDGASGEVFNAAGDIVDGAEDEMDDLQHRFNVIGNNAMYGLRDGISGREDTVMSEANRIAGRVTSTFERALQIKSPSRVLMRIGQFVGEGLAEGMADEVRTVERMARLLAEAATPETPKVAGVDIEGFRGQVSDISTRLRAEVSGSERGVSTTNNYYQGMLEGASFHVREEADIDRITTEIARKSEEAGRIKGIRRAPNGA